MQTIKSELLELLRRNDLLKAALLVGKVHDTNFSIDYHFERIMEIAAQVWHRCARTEDVVLKAKEISRALFHDFNLIGKSEKEKNTIDDPNRYYMHSVLDKKTGSPLAVTILYSILADQVGLKHECLAMPTYYLIKITDVTGDIFIDPYDNGRFLNAEEFQKKMRSAIHRSKMTHSSLFERVNAYQLIARLVQQLKHIYILKSKAPEALRAVELLTGLFPQSPELTRDRGILYCEIEYFSKAAEDLKFYLTQRPNASDVNEIKKLTNMLKGCREIMN